MGPRGFGWQKARAAVASKDFFKKPLGTGQVAVPMARATRELG